MNDDFDKKLSERIKYVLENDQETYDPQNLEKLIAKMSGKNEVSSSWRFSRSMKAVILLFIIGGLSGIYIYNIFVNKNIKKVVQKNIEYQNGKTATIIEKEYFEETLRLAEHSKKSIGRDDGSIQSKELFVLTKDFDFLKEEIKSKNVDLLQNGENKPLESGLTFSRITPITQKLTSDSQLVNNIYSRIENQKNINFSNNQIKFGISFSSIVNYDQADEKARVGLGAGVFFEIPIKNGLEFYSGIFLSNQKINFQENQLEPISVGRHLKSKEAILYSFDIPINLKYNLSLLSTNIFITAGFSSVINFKEKIELTYQVGKPFTSLTLDEFGNPIILTTVANSYEGEIGKPELLNIFFPVKIFNFSFGVELPFRNSQQVIVIEPYFKYSLGPLSKGGIHTSSLGINLGIKF